MEIKSIINNPQNQKALGRKGSLAAIFNVRGRKAAAGGAPPSLFHEASTSSHRSQTKTSQEEEPQAKLLMSRLGPQQSARHSEPNNTQKGYTQQPSGVIPGAQGRSNRQKSVAPSTSSRLKEEKITRAFQ